MNTMKIDDPNVQAYIKGQLSPEEEAEFQEELAEHPEVADLAETLKRTAALMDEDRSNDEKPYGLDLRKATAKKLFDDDEEPEAAWARFFHGIMGKSWRFGVILLSGAFVIFVFAFIVVPFVRSLQAPVDTVKASPEIQELEKAAEKNKQSSGGMKNRNIPTHATQNKKVNQDMAEAFSKALDPTGQVISAEAVQTLSDLAKVSSTAGPSQSSEGAYQLPTSYETGLQEDLQEQILEQGRWDKKAIQTDAFANSYFHSKSSNQADSIQVSAEWRTAPWDNREILLMLDVQAPREKQSLNSDQVRMVIVADSADTLEKNVATQLGSNVPVTDIREDFSKSMNAELEKATTSKQKFLFLADSNLSVEQADYFLLSTERFPHLDFAFLSMATHVDENHFRIRKKLRLQNVGEFFTAGTPSQLRRSLEASLRSSDQVYRDFRWNVEFDKNFISSSQLVGAVPKQGTWESVTPSHWMMSNDRTVVFFRLRLNEVSPNSKIGTVRASWRQGEATKTQSLSVPLIRADASILIPETTYQFASAVIHVGLMLKGEIPMSKKALSEIGEGLNGLAMEPGLEDQKRSFLNLVSSLRAL